MKTLLLDALFRLSATMRKQGETMKTADTCSRTLRILALALACLVGACCWTFAQSNIDTSNKYAWAENAGWVNFAPTNGGVTVVPPGAGNGSLSGYAWGENIGWIRMGNTNGQVYQNTTATNWGVNIVAGRPPTLDGYAWSENCGWIHFSSTNSQATIDASDGRFDGYAWAENVGWIHFKGTNATTYVVRTTARFSVGGTVISIK
jgi:hypothetical protein